MDNATSGDSLVVDLAGGFVEIAVDGDFSSGAQVVLMAEPPGVGKFLPVGDGGDRAVWDEPLIKGFAISRACKIKLTIEGTTSGISAWV